MSKLWIMLALYFATTDAHFQFRDAGDHLLSISRRRITRSPFRDAKSLAFNFTMPEYARSLLIANSQFCDTGKRSLARNRSLSILQRHKSFTLYFAAPEIADSQFCDARNRSHSILRQRKVLTVNFAMPEIARSLFCFAGNRSLSILRCQKIARSTFDFTGNCSLSILRCQELLTSILRRRTTRSQSRGGPGNRSLFCFNGNHSLSILCAENRTLSSSRRQKSIALSIATLIIARSQLRDAGKR
jgi:hypothetical protein